MNLDNGQQTQYVYYTATQQGGRLYQIKTGPTGTPTSTLYLQYGYDRVGNVTVITDHNNSGQLQLFAYDALNRLTSAAAIGGLDGYYTRTYQYDAIGNLTLGDGGYYYYDSLRPHAVITVGNPLSSMTAYYGNDGNGSATFITRTSLLMTYTLAYDPENRVKQVVPSDGPTAIFRYDGDGTRVLGIVGGVTTTYAGTGYEYTTEGISYYYFNGQRVAMRSATGVTYTHRDHLGSAVATTGVVTQGQRYDAWGETRGVSTVDTPYRYTGQREEDDLLLYSYNARWYDAALGRFIQADSIVPEPGNPQSLNRYSYVLSNPLRHIDPSGYQECSPGDQQCWENEWRWKNRWYRAQGYSWGGTDWSQTEDPSFEDEGIMDEVLSEAGITLRSSLGKWTMSNKAKAAFGASKFGQRLQKGMEGLKSLLGGYALLLLESNSPWYCRGNSCAPPPPLSDGHVAYFPEESFTSVGLVEGAQTVVHELAHIVDWQTMGTTRRPSSFSLSWSAYGPTTSYAATGCPRHWENWAEAVTVWVFGEGTGGGFRSGYQQSEIGMSPEALWIQMDRLQQMLDGWR